MKANIYEFEFDDGLYLNFEKFDDIDHLANIIENNNIAELIDSIVGIVSINKIYKKKDLEFELIFHEDLGNCLRLPINRDRSQDVENYELLRKIGKEVMNILNAKKK